MSYPDVAVYLAAVAITFIESDLTFSKKEKNLGPEDANAFWTAFLFLGFLRMSLSEREENGIVASSSSLGQSETNTAAAELNLGKDLHKLDLRVHSGHW